MRPLTITEAKERLTIHDLWRILDLPGKPGKSCRCPWREDRKPSFSVSDDGRLYNDFTKGEGGDGIDFLRNATELSGEAAFKKFIELAGGAHPSPLPTNKRSTAGPQEAQRALPTLPAMRHGTQAEHQALADLRGVSPEAVRCLDVHAGILRFGMWQNEAAWFVTDRKRVAQARRMDGKTYASGAKATTTTGSWASWPIGLEQAEHHPFVVLVEGGPDMLAAVHFALDQLRGDCFPVAMLGAGQRIHPEALPLLAGKRIRICAHADDAGRGAAQRWAQQLESVGCCVDALDLAGLRKMDGAPAKDLNDLVRIHPEDAAELKGLLPE